MNHIMEVARRLKGLRDALDLSVEDMAAQCGISVEDYIEFEDGKKDIPVSLLHRIASTQGVELTALLFGEEPKMDAYFVTRAGKGVKVERTKAYSYQDVAAGFAHRKLAPFIVTVEPQDTPREMVLNTHQGQDFNYIIEGTMEISVGGKSLILNQGDSIMFDATRPHAMRAIGDTPVRFLAIIS